MTSVGVRGNVASRNVALGCTERQVDWKAGQVLGRSRDTNGEAARSQVRRCSCGDAVSLRLREPGVG